MYKFAEIIILTYVLLFNVRLSGSILNLLIDVYLFVRNCCRNAADSHSGKRFV